MKILILSYYFPPHPGMGTRRVGLLADFLSRAGHDVRVVAARHAVEEMNDPRDRSVTEVSHTRWLDVNLVPDQATRVRNWMRGQDRRSANISPQTNSCIVGDPSAPNARDVLSRLDRLFRHCVNLPDDKVGWLPFAIWQSWRTARAFKPDLIYASSPPPTGLVVASWLSRRLSVPWVAEIRDRWADDPYVWRPAWRKALDLRLECSVLSTARGIVTVSETWAPAYRERYGKPTAVVYNGFMPGNNENHALQPQQGERDKLRIVYTGAVYIGRDPTPLWKAVRSMGRAAKGIQIEFYGCPDEAIRSGAIRHGVSEMVLHAQERLPHDESERRQCLADILLLLQWNSPSEAGQIPGKLFEYLGARRPILALGYEEGEMARIINERKAGLVANDPDSIARQLHAWRDEKRQTGHIPPLPEAVRTGFSWDEQFAKLEGFLEASL